jgi:hypothetical protein
MRMQVGQAPSLGYCHAGAMQIRIFNHIVHPGLLTLLTIAPHTPSLRKPVALPRRRPSVPVYVYIRSSLRTMEVAARWTGERISNYITLSQP